jgi:hypothetical protein
MQIPYGRPFSATNHRSTDIYCCGQSIYTLSGDLQIHGSPTSVNAERYINVSCPHCEKKIKIPVSKQSN